MEEVRGAVGPWTVASDSQNRGEKGVLVVKSAGFGGGKMDTNGHMKRPR